MLISFLVIFSVLNIFANASEYEVFSLIFGEATMSSAFSSSWSLSSAIMTEMNTNSPKIVCFNYSSGQLEGTLSKN